MNATADAIKMLKHFSLNSLTLMQDYFRKVESWLKDNKTKKDNLIATKYFFGPTFFSGSQIPSGGTGTPTNGEFIPQIE